MWNEAGAAPAMWSEQEKSSGDKTRRTTADFQDSRRGGRRSASDTLNTSHHDNNNNDDGKKGLVVFTFGKGSRGLVAPHRWFDSTRNDSLRCGENLDQSRWGRRFASGMDARICSGGKLCPFESPSQPSLMGHLHTSASYKSTDNPHTHMHIWCLAQTHTQTQCSWCRGLRAPTKPKEFLIWFNI